MNTPANETILNVPLARKGFRIMENRTAEKRVVKSESGSAAEIRSLILTAVLLAAGAVLKFFAGSVINIGGMKPNFIIAMYCLAILLIRPTLARAAVKACWPARCASSFRARRTSTLSRRSWARS